MLDVLDLNKLFQYFYNTLEIFSGSLKTQKFCSLSIRFQIKFQREMFVLYCYEFKLTNMNRLKQQVTM